MAKLYPIPSRAPKNLCTIPFDTLCGYLFSCGLSIHHHDGHAVIDWLRGGYPAWLPEAAAEHADALDTLAKCRWLDMHIEKRLRILEEGVDDDLRARGLIYLDKQMSALTKACGGAEGYLDPAWPLSKTCCADLGRRLAKLS